MHVIVNNSAGDWMERFFYGLPCWWGR